MIFDKILLGEHPSNGNSIYANLYSYNKNKKVRVDASGYVDVEVSFSNFLEKWKSHYVTMKN
jgi:hypothetical protein